MTITPVKLGAKSKLVLPANPQRAYLAIQNQDDRYLYVNFGVAAHYSSALYVAGWGYFEPLIAPRDPLHMASANSDAQCVVIEGVW